MSYSKAIIQFKRWLEEADSSESVDPTAVALATSDSLGRPSVRMVLLKNADEKGFVFYTNLDSRKALEIGVNPYASMCFHWKSLRRQVRIDGLVQEVSEKEADKYFDSRDKDSQIGAWASKQSRVMVGRFELEKNVAFYAAKFALSRVPRPSFWSGFRLVPDKIEFWADKPFRLHDRTLYRNSSEGWIVEKLYP